MVPVSRNILDAVIEFTDKNLTETAKQYFLSRGWDESVISKWHLGFFPRNKNSELFSVLSKYKFQKAQLEDLYIMNQKGNTLLFDRVIFPIWDVSGKSIAVTGRVLDEGVKPKYFNTAYDKGLFLYGLNFAKNKIREMDVVYVFEGNADIVTAHTLGIENCVGCQGTAFTKDHYSLLARYTSNICLIFDDDAGGQIALARFNKKSEDIFSKDKSNIFKTKEKEVNLSLVVLKEEKNMSILGSCPEKLINKKAKDPDDFLRKYGPEQFLKTVTEQRNNKILQIQRKKIFPEAVQKNAKKRNVQGRV